MEDKHGHNDQGAKDTEWRVDQDGDVAMKSPNELPQASQGGEKGDGQDERRDSDGDKEEKGEKPKNTRPARLPRIPPRTYPGLRCK